MAVKPKILIVDDEALVSMALAEELKEQGFDVMCLFGSSEKIMSALDDNLPDAAFLDVNLGLGRTSYELAAMLMEKGVPVTFVTGYDEVHVKDDRFAEAAYLTKPVFPEHAVAQAYRMLKRTESA